MVFIRIAPVRKRGRIEVVSAKYFAVFQSDYSNERIM
jgi:hypothetical protein